MDFDKIYIDSQKQIFNEVQVIKRKKIVVPEIKFDGRAYICGGKRFIDKNNGINSDVTDESYNLVESLKYKCGQVNNPQAESLVEKCIFKFYNIYKPLNIDNVPLSNHKINDNNRHRPTHFVPKVACHNLLKRALKSSNLKKCIDEVRYINFFGYRFPVKVIFEFPSVEYLDLEFPYFVENGIEPREMMYDVSNIRVSVSLINHADEIITAYYVPVSDTTSIDSSDWESWYLSDSLDCTNLCDTKTYSINKTRENILRSMFGASKDRINLTLLYDDKKAVQKP